MTARTWSQDLEYLRTTLTRAQQTRYRRQEFGQLEHGNTELGWVLYEREQMLAAVNALHAAAGKAPVSSDQLQAAESSACGHVDYTSKFAIGCADLVAAE